MKDRPSDVDLIIPMIPEMEVTASKTAGAVAEFMKLDADQVDEIKIALIEACINAFEHSQSQDGRVSINFDVGDRGLTIRITDRGHGFDLTRVQERLEERREEGQRHRGWGLRIMQELMDEVEIDSDERGTTITMVKRS